MRLMDVCIERAWPVCVSGCAREFLGACAPLLRYIDGREFEGRLGRGVLRCALHVCREL